MVTSRPSSRRTGVTQATRGAPSTQTVQQPHWPWGLQPSLTERSAELLAEDLEQGRTVVGDLDVGAVDAEPDQGISVDQLKEEPQPQVRLAFGLVTWNPAPCSPSL